MFAYHLSGETNAIGPAAALAACACYYDLPEIPRPAQASYKLWTHSREPACLAALLTLRAVILTDDSIGPSSARDIRRLPEGKDIIDFLRPLDDRIGDLIDTAPNWPSPWFAAAHYLTAYPQERIRGYTAEQCHTRWIETYESMETPTLLAETGFNSYISGGPTETKIPMELVPQPRSRYEIYVDD